MKEVAELIQAIAALLYPIVIFTVIMIFKGEIIDLVKRLKKGKFLGQELELGESLDKLDESALEATKEVLALPKAEGNKSENATNTENIAELNDFDETEKILSLAKNSPKLALISLATEIEKEVRNLIFSYGYSKDVKPFTLPKAIQILEENLTFLHSTLASLRDFQSVRNKIVHGYEATSDDILRAIDSGIIILKTLRAIPREVNTVHHPGVEIFSDEKCMQIRNDAKGVILETTSPGGTIKSYRIFPTTRNHFEKGKTVAWEWDNSKIWNETWYRDPDTNEIKQAWLGSMEFIGRNMDDM